MKLIFLFRVRSINNPHATDIQGFLNISTLFLQIAFQSSLNHHIQSHRHYTFNPFIAFVLKSLRGEVIDND